MTRLTVAAGAEWVSAPMEMRSAPAAAIALTFLSVIPPDTSTRACFLISTTARRTMSGAMLSNRIISGFPVSAWRTSERDSTSTIIGSALDRWACANRHAFSTGRRLRSEEGQMIVFNENAVA